LLNLFVRDVHAITKVILPFLDSKIVPKHLLETCRGIAVRFQNLFVQVQVELSILLESLNFTNAASDFLIRWEIALFLGLLEHQLATNELLENTFANMEVLELLFAHFRSAEHVLEELELAVVSTVEL